MSGPVKRPTTRASKDQILAAFDQLNSEYKKVAAGAAAAPKESNVASASDSKAASRADDARPQDASIEGTIAALLALRAGFGGAVSELSAKLTAEASRLAEL